MAFGKAAFALATALLMTGTVAFAAETGPFNPADVKGKITFYTHWTNYVTSGDMDRWETEFKTMFPNVEDVDIIGVGDMDGLMPQRLATGDYGDVLTSLGSVLPRQYKDFFLPLDDIGMQDNYYTPDRWKVDGHYYGFTYGVNEDGVVYNKKAFADAGVTVPTTWTEFLAACDKLKAAGKTPLLINMASGWPMGSWERLATLISGDPDYYNKLLDNPAPFDEGTPLREALDKTEQLFTAGYTEADYTSDGWEASKTELAVGNAGMWNLGPWSINQVIDAGKAASADGTYDSANIGYFPLPYSDKGPFNVTIGPDKALHVSSKSTNPITAKAWLWFLLTKTDLSQIAGFIPGEKSLPPTLPQLKELAAYNPVPIEAAANSDRLIAVGKAAQIDFGGGGWVRDLISSGDYEAGLADLNARWAKALKDTP